MSGLAADFDVEAAREPGDAVLDRNGMRLFLPAERRLSCWMASLSISRDANTKRAAFHDPKSRGASCPSSQPMVMLDSLLRPRREPRP